MAHSNTVDIVAKERMTINTKWWDGVNIPNDVETTQTILELKNTLAQEQSIDEHLILLSFKGNEFHDEQTFKDVKELAGGANIVGITAMERDEIAVMMPDRTTINLEMEPTQKILDAKKLLADKSGIDVSLMKLFFKDSEVTDDSDIMGVQ